MPNQSKKAKAYFQKLTKGGPYGRLNDTGEQYLICLMVGLINEERISEVGPKVEIMVRGWTDAVKGNKSLILGSTIATEVKRKSLPTDKERYREFMLRTLSGEEGLFNLTPEGAEMLDQYAEGGFRLIKETLPEPVDLDTFLYNIYENFLISEL